MQTSNTHQPVMLDNIMQQLSLLYPLGGKGMNVIDATFGRGGYSQKLLEWGASVVALDRDDEAVKQGEKLKIEYGEQFTIVKANFADIKKVASSPDMVIFDFGVSSPQLDNPERGFSFMHDGPLDMRMDKSQDKTAMDIVNEYSESELMRIFKEFGEEKHARQIANKIIYRRQQTPITTTKMLGDIVESAIMRANYKKGHKQGHKSIHPATKVFQALRIEVNDELSAIEQGVTSATDIIAKGGSVICVSFHSLEDRIVKNIFNRLAGKQSSPSRHVPMREQQVPEFSLPYKKLLQPNSLEMETNPRARSAKMRIIQKTAENNNKNKNKEKGYNHAYDII